MKKLPDVIEVYNKLLAHFGPQGWWPTTKVRLQITDYRLKAFESDLIPQYHPLSYEVIDETEKFEICIGAILTQNTAWSNVVKALTNLHKTGIFTPKQLYRLSETQLAGLIRPSGYYNQKTVRLKNFSRHIQKKYQGKLEIFFDRKYNIVRDELLSLNGIGPETADSMMLYVGNIPTFVIDAYTLRLAKRIGWINNYKYDNTKSFFERNLSCSVKIFNEYHALIVSLGKNFCKKTPQCEACPLKCKELK